MTREEFEALLEEAYEEGVNAAYGEVEDAIHEAEMYEDEDQDAYDESDEIEIEDDAEGYDEDAVLEALDLKRRLNNVPSPREAYQGLKGMASRGGSNFKKGVNSFRKRVLGKAGKVVSGKYDDARKKLIKAKSKALLKMKNL